MGTEPTEEQKRERARIAAENADRMRDTTGETREQYLARINSTHAAPHGYQPTMGSRQMLSTAGAHTDGGLLVCPRCGSASFKAKRSIKGKIGFGLLAPKTQVKCEACGTMYKRG